MSGILFAGALAEEAAETAVGTSSGMMETVFAWGKEAIRKFAETPATLWISLLVVAALAVVMLVISKSSKAWDARMIAFGALAVSLSFVLSCIRLFRMPQGGSVTPGSMLPIMLFAAAFGMGPGLLAGLSYGVLQCIQGGGFINVLQFALDYLLAFTALGLAGLAKYWPKKWGLYPAITIAAIGRALFATLAGIVIWESAPWASLVYNGTYLIPDTAICLVLAVLIGNRMVKLMKAGR